MSGYVGSPDFDPTKLPWRIGRSVSRTLYAAIGDDASKADVLLGLVDTRQLAEHIVAVHNAWITECQEFGCHEA